MFGVLILEQIYKLIILVDLQRICEQFDKNFIGKGYESLVRSRSFYKDGYKV